MNDRASPTGNLIDLSDMTPAHVRLAMGWLGYELPATLSPADTAAAMALLQELPAGALASALNPGMRIEFTSALPSPAIPESFRYNGGMTTTASVEASLSSVQVRPGFDRQHTFEASVELTGGWSMGAGRSDVNRIVRGVEQYFPDWVERHRDTIDNWPRTRDFARGPDWMKGGFDHESFEGGRLSYEAVVPPAVAARIDAGEIAAVPNPLRPMEMPIGSSVVITGESITGSTMEFTYKLLRDTTDTIELEGRAFGITRIDENIVELTTGPIAAVEHGAYQSVGMSIANLGIQRSERYEGGELDVVRLDLSTPEGQTAYSAFMQSGTLPDAIGPGVVEVASRLMIGGEAELSGRASFLGGSISGANPTEFDKTLTRFSDGTSEQRATLVGTSNRVGFEIFERYDSDEQPIPGSREWTVLLEGMSASAGASLRAAYSGQGYDASDMPDGARAELRFTDEELMRLRDSAREMLRVEQPETYARMESNRTAEGLGDRLDDSGDMIQRLAAANTPEEVFDFGFMYADASPESIAEGLRGLSMPPSGQDGPDTAPPGSLEIRDPALEPLYPAPPDAAVQPDAETPAVDPRSEDGRWPVSLEGLSANDAAYLKSAFSGAPYDPDMPAGTSAELRFSDEELMRLRDTAREALRVEQPEAYARIESNRSAEALADRLEDSLDMTQRLAAANTPEEVHALGFMHPNASTANIAETLLGLSMPPGVRDGPDTPLAGSLEIRDAAREPLFVHPPAVPVTSATVATPVDASPGFAPEAAPFRKEGAIDPAALEGRPRSNFLRATEAVGMLDLPAPFADEVSRRRIAACATAHACEQSMTIDHLMLSRATGQVAQGEKVLLVQGAPQDPACRVESLATAVAARTPVDDSLARIERQQTPTPAETTNPALAATQGQESPTAARR